MKPHPLNVVGDFYVEDGCCTACEVPFSEAADLFGMTDDPYFHCYVKRQPTNETETDQMLSAIMCAELQCIHYRGKDVPIISRLSAMGEMDVCDTPPPTGTELGIRNHATFESNESKLELSDLAHSFRSFLATQEHEYCKFKFLPSDSASVVTFMRNDDDLRNVVFEQSNTQIHVFHDGPDVSGISWYIARWLTAQDEYKDIRWFTDDGWNNTGKWHPKHW